MTTLPTARLLESLDADFHRLHDLAANPGSLTVKVPTCPEWTVADLVDHVATVYLHKVETMRLGAFPKDWPPQRDPEPPAAYLLRAHSALAEEFAARSPEEQTMTWFEPDQSVGFWIRRMTYETLIHRVDGELAVGVQPAPIPEDVAVDGVHEVLTTHLAYASEAWPEDFEGALPSAGETVLLQAGDTAWLITLADRVAITPAEPGVPADVTLVGDPAAVLLWVWRRADSGTLTEQGRGEVAAKLREFLRLTTQ